MTGHRPTVGTRDNKDLLSVVDLATAALHANLPDSPKNAEAKTGKSKTRRMPEAFAAHLRHVGRVYPAGTYRRVVLVIDHAPWHRGKLIDEALADNRHLEFDRLPSYSPQWNPAERFRKKLRRRATHNRLFDTLVDLKASVRNSRRCFQTVRHKVKTLLTGRQRKTVPK